MNENGYFGNGDFLTENRTARELWTSIYKRFLELAIKLVSVKGLCLALSAVMLILGYIDKLVFMAIIGAVIGGKVGEKLANR